MVEIGRTSTLTGSSPLAPSRSPALAYPCAAADLPPPWHGSAAPSGWKIKSTRAVGTTGSACLHIAPGPWMLDRLKSRKHGRLNQLGVEVFDSYSRPLRWIFEWLNQAS